MVSERKKIREEEWRYENQRWHSNNAMFRRLPQTIWKLSEDGDLFITRIPKEKETHKRWEQFFDAAVKAGAIEERQRVYECETYSEIRLTGDDLRWIGNTKEFPRKKHFAFNGVSR